MIQFRLSGGATNTNPALSTGGAMSNTGFGGEGVNWASAPIPGITLVSSAGNYADSSNSVRSAKIFVVKPTETVTNIVFKPYGPEEVQYASAFTNVIGVSNLNGVESYTLHWPGQYLRITVDPASLPATSTEAALTVSWNKFTLFDEITKTEAAAAQPDYRCVYIYNTTGVSKSVEISFENVPGGSTLVLAEDAAGVGGTASSNPVSLTYSTTLQKTIPNNQAYPIWIKRMPNPLNPTDFVPDSACMTVEVLI